jgi:hypothetical protein
MNWRVLVGLVFLFAGFFKLYAIMADAAAKRLGGNPTFAEIGCGVWIFVGILLVVNGMKKKEL